MLPAGAHVQCLALGLHVSAQNSLSSGRESPDLAVGLCLPKKIAGLTCGQGCRGWRWAAEVVLVAGRCSAGPSSPVGGCISEKV